MVQQYIADSFIQLEQFRLLVLYTAWHIDKGHKREARTYIAAVKVQMAEVLHDVVRRAAAGARRARLLERDAARRACGMAVPVMAIADGPTEVHKLTVAKQVLRSYQPYEGLWPRDFLPDRVAEARARFAEYLEHEVGNL